jgi:hypothetical protein
MQKVLLSITLALLMALAVVGVKRIATPADASRGTVLVAEGGMPVPPDSFREGGMPVPPDTLKHEGGMPVPPDTKF